jgi:uncharacterized protein YndB with AHSA1/START domain
MQSSSVDERPSLILIRTFPVAPEKVWRAWTDPDALRIWWNQADSPPERESVVTVELHATEGGTELQFRQEPIFDERARDGWRGAFKRLGQLLQQTN